MRWGALIFAGIPLILAVGVAHAQGIPQGSFGSGEAKARPDNVDQDLLGTPRDVRTVPRAPTLPDLTHRAPELSIEHTVASIAPHGQTDPSVARLTSHLLHFDFELPLWTPHLYAGAEWGFAAARGPEAPKGAFVSGQPQLFARVVRSFSRERYSVGAGLGLSPPIFRYDDAAETTRLQKGATSSFISVVRPWDLSAFLDRRLTARPFIDVRAAVGRLVLQARQGVDVGLRTQGACTENVVCDKAGDVQLVSLTSVYLGWQPTREVALGLEAWEVYLVKTTLTVNDHDRNALALSPSVRFYYRFLEPAISVLFPLGQPLLNAVDSYFALRIDLRVWL